MIRLVNDLKEFRQLLHVTVMCAPDKFPVRDYLQPEDQLTLDTAFKDLHYGMQFVAKHVKDAERLSQIQAMLDEALVSYKQGLAIEGAHLLQDLEDMIFGKPSYRP